MHLVTVVGARPQFVKASVISRLLRDDPVVTETLIHTGQHYDPELSETFFDELELPEPDVNLAVGSASHGVQVARMLEGLEAALKGQRPDGVVLYGDTNSTLAGALAAVSLGLPVAHVEAGLRSYDRRMPEEVNRVVADHLAALRFCPTSQSISNLEREGLFQGNHHVGDVMCDVLQQVRPKIVERMAFLGTLGLKPAEYVVGTLHRAENTDDPARLEALMDGLGRLAERVEVVIPLHPRTRTAWATHMGRPLPGGPRFIEPVPYVTMLALVQEAAALVTDSGGLQKESAWLGTPCLTIRDVTEWVETVESGWNILVGADPDRLLAAWEALPKPEALEDLGPLFGGGRAGERIVSILKEEWTR